MQTRNGVYYEPAPIDGKTAFLFPGEMAQYPGMMSEAVMAFPQVRAWFDLVASLCDGKRDVRLQDVAFPPPSGVDEAGQKHLTDLLHSVDYGSEMVFAADQAVYGLLRELGVQPDALLGHSTGENAAIVASNWFQMSREDIGETIAKMNGVFNTVNSSGEIPEGQLLTIAGLARDEFLNAFNAHDGLHFTMDNCPNQAIVFGPADVVAAMQKDVVDMGAVCTTLPISWGYHTEYVAPMAQGFGQLFADFKMSPNDTQIYSCATAQPFPETQREFLDTAISQYVSRVAFREAIENMYDAGFRRFIECGPNATLTAFVRDTLAGKPVVIASADNRRRGMVAQLRHLVAQLFTSGLALDYPALLDPRVTKDMQRRADVAAKRRKAPVLPSNLPFPDLDEADRQHLRDLMQVGQPSVQPLAAPAIAMPHGTSTAVGQHMSVMSQFLHAQERVATTALGAGYPKRQIEVMDLTAQFNLPMDYRAILMRGAPSPQAMARHLAESERALATDMATGGPECDRWIHWSLGRLAIKRAAKDYFAQHSMPLENDQISVAKTENGAPFITLPQQGMQLAGASIAHSGGVAVGAVAAHPWRIGVDYELPDRIRDPAGFLERVMSEREAAMLPITATAEAAVTIWSIKEAAAKTLGVGLQGRPHQFEIVEYDPATASARVANEGFTVDTCSGRVGAGVYSVGYLLSA